MIDSLRTKTRIQLYFNDASVVYAQQRVGIDEALVDYWPQLQNLEGLNLNTAPVHEAC